MTDRLIDKLKASYLARRTMVEIMGMEVWVTPMTIGEQTTVTAMHPDNSASRMAETLIRKCRDKDDKPLFTKDDKTDLRTAVAVDALGPLIAAIVGQSAEAQAKNSEAVDPLTTDTP